MEPHEEEENLDMKTPETGNEACFSCVMARHFGLCPFASIPLFWKVTMAVTGVLMLILVFTTWGVSRNLATYSEGIAVIRVQNDRQFTATMENRAIQTEVKGLLTGHISEERTSLLKDLIDRQIKIDKEKSTIR